MVFSFEILHRFRKKQKQSFLNKTLLEGQGSEKRRKSLASEPTVLTAGGPPLTEDIPGRSVRQRSEGSAGDQDEPEAGTRNEETGNEVPKSVFPVADELSVFYCNEGCFRSGQIVQSVRNIVKCRLYIKFVVFKFIVGLDPSNYSELNGIQLADFLLSENCRILLKPVSRVFYNTLADFRYNILTFPYY